MLDNVSLMGEQCCRIKQFVCSDNVINLLPRCFIKSASITSSGEVTFRLCHTKVYSQITYKIVIHLYKLVSYEFNHNLQKGLDWVNLLGKISFKDLNENFWI